MTRPNLFTFATSELSQDAFLGWLLTWADPSYRDADEPLHEAGVALLCRLLAAAGLPAPADCRAVKVKRQHERIDLLVLVNSDLALVIEDKTHTEDAAGKLLGYLASARDEFAGRAVGGVYLKTGDQGWYGEIDRAGYGRFGRRELLDALRHGKELGVSNDIYDDFLDHLQAMEDAVQAYRTRPVSSWDGCCWVGFFSELQERMGDGRWQEVFPPGQPGFMAMLWHWRGGKFLQLEEERLAFKIEVTDKARQKADRQAWRDAVVAAAASAGLPVQPTPSRQGTWMTVARLDAADYRVAGEGGLIDVARTIETLRKAEAIMDAALAGLPAAAAGPPTAG
jgi:hypothetical protein